MSEQMAYAKEFVDLSIVIVNWNTQKLLAQCLDSVYDTVHSLQFEVFVVDNGSQDGSGWGVYGTTPNGRGVFGESTNGTGVYGSSTNGYAGYFNGTVRVDVLEIAGADVAEKFPVSETVDPGMLVMIDTENPGQLCLSRGEYNRCVAGVASGAGDIFGTTGGVMEATLRAASELLTGKPADRLDFTEVRAVESPCAGDPTPQSCVRVAELRRRRR